ncbi:MAG: homoserine dehydrogenase [Rickettsiales bacterium]|jgi:homoserine dehydrogenase
MSTPLRIAIAGLGTVGSGTLSILREKSDLLTVRCGRPLQVVAVSARNRTKKRDVNTGGLRWVYDPLTLSDDPEVDVVVEAMGGADGAAKTLVETALANGKSVVTANKALIAHHGVELAKLAEKSGAVLAFEAAVAGGIPIVKTMRDGLAANNFSRVIGILNGTCNYILTSMWETNRSFDEVLKEAQDLGYAEADPSFDVDGIDTAHKISILASLAYGCLPNMKNVYIEGIRRVTLRDMKFADELGYNIKLLGISMPTKNGIQQRVHPCMVAKDSMLGTVRDVYNAVLVDGDAVGRVFLEGPGAGALPTGSSVVADIMDIACGVKYKPFTLPVSALSKAKFASMDNLNCSYYLRLSVVDKSGVLAEVTRIFKEQKISLRSFLQHLHEPNEIVQLVLITHNTNESAMLSATKAVAALDSMREPPFMIRIEEF